MDRKELIEKTLIRKEDMFYTLVSIAEEKGISQECLSHGIEAFQDAVIKKMSDFFLDCDIIRMVYERAAIKGNIETEIYIRKMYRIAKGISQTELSRISGVRQEHISAYESGVYERRSAARAYEYIGFGKFMEEVTK